MHGEICRGWCYSVAVRRHGRIRTIDTKWNSAGPEPGYRLRYVMAPSNVNSFG